MKVSYGTTKYCSYFLKKYDCPNLKDCYFLHKWDVDNELTVDDNSKQVFNKQLKLAMAVIAENL
jgi:CCR4-NOT transcription complex subunit 4